MDVRDNSSQANDTFSSSSVPSRYKQSIVLQKRRVPIPSFASSSYNTNRHQNDASNKLSFEKLPTFNSFVEPTISPLQRSRYGLGQRSSSVHTLNVNGDEFVDDVPPMRSQNDDNFDILNRSKSSNSLSLYHNYDTAHQGKLIGSFVRKVSVPGDTRVTVKSLDQFLKPLTPNSALSQIHENSISHDTDVDSLVQWRKYVSKFLLMVLVLLVILYKGITRLIESMLNTLTPELQPVDSAEVEEHVNGEVFEADSTPLAKKSVWIDEDVNVSSLNWGKRQDEVVKEAPISTDYGTRFIETEDNELDPEFQFSQPNLELEYIRKIFNNDGKLKLQFNNQSVSNGLRINTTNLVENLHRLMGSYEVDQTIDDDVKVVKATLPVSKFDIGYNDNLNDESLLLFEEEFRTYQSIVEEKRRRQELIRDLKRQKESKIKTLGPDQTTMVKEVLSSRDINREIKNIGGIDLKVRDLRTLQNLQWLNDNVIDAYLKLITLRSQNSGDSTCFAFTTHFYTTLLDKGYKSVARWAKRQKVDVTKLDYIFVPINSLNTHWSLLVINNKSHKFQYFDSLSFEMSDDDMQQDSQVLQFHRGKNMRILSNLIDYMTQEDKRLHGESTIDFNSYHMLPVIRSPQQRNGSDCGVFTCTAVEFLSRDQYLNFSQADMPNLRLKMCYELITGKLL